MASDINRLLSGGSPASPNGRAHQWGRHYHVWDKSWRIIHHFFPTNNQFQSQSVTFGIVSEAWHHGTVALFDNWPILSNVFFWPMDTNLS
jgi:hypothetical protein